MIATALYGSLTVGSLIAVVVFTCLAALFVHRALTTRPTSVSGDEVGSGPAALKKVRKDEQLTDEEIAIARQVINTRRSLLAYSTPAAIFSIGCFYVFGSLEHLHGATPSERTFLGVIPMFTAVNVTLQLLRSARLNRRLPSERRARRAGWLGRRDARTHPAGRA